ncbi:hypothetical protein [Streptosporangium sp. NBC_01469]|uniref:hypothetical protein n=1 Tax=Streptosporangium sp. NBC_01469 TaxID=2903898 RepID=UPI002E2ADFA2|nr:hypothetical protein [Streptosporangium sp. NBC_01469]
MSFELAVWYEPKPITREHAENIFRSLRHGDRENAGTPSPGELRHGTGPGPDEREDAEAYPGVAAFADRLPGAEWLSPAHVLVGVEPERADEVSAEVFALAAECGLVCYDPQRGLVHNLSPRGVYPTMEMRTGDGMIVVGPDLQLISDALATMSPQNPFTALVVFGEHFVQSSPEISGYELEYKDSVRDRMFRTHVPDLGAVQDAFTEYATGERAFLERHDWRLV